MTGTVDADPPAAALELPVARVVVDTALAHLDRLFDYAVPPELAGTAVAGVRVRVRFAGRRVGGFITDRVATSDRAGLARLETVVSAEPVLSPEVAVLARATADRYAGTLADVLRLAVPPRHARVEAEPTTAAPPEPPEPPEPAGWAAYDGGAAFLAALGTGRAPRAVWTALPGEDWPARLAGAVRASLAAGRGALLVVPDGRDLARVDAALRAALGDGRHVALRAELGPAERYRRWLAVRRGRVRAVVGTRAAMFAPVAGLGLVAIWDDGDDLHAEPRAPYPHAREVLVLRAQLTGSAALLAGQAQTAEGALLVRSGWSRSVAAGRAAVRARAPRVQAAGGDADVARDAAARTARLPTLAWTAARAALAAGAPVLVQVPRRGYQPALSCDRCRAKARCRSCAGPLARSAAAATASCRWCGRSASGWRCEECAGERLRAAVVGAARTAEELGRGFPGVQVRTSGREQVIDTVPAEPVLVVATPGAEPVAVDGYGAVLLLDGWALLGRAGLRAGEEALRRWLAAATLARPAVRGGTVVVMADGALAPVQALLGWAPARAAERELAERSELGLPPAARFAAVSGAPAAVAELLRDARLPAGAQTLGPIPVARTPARGPGDPGAAPVRALVRGPRPAAADLAAALHAAAGVRSARKAEGVRIQIDPLELV